MTTLTCDFVESTTLPWPFINWKMLFICFKVQGVLGFNLRRRFQIKGKKTGMVCADMVRDGMCFVLCQGTESESQVSQLVENFGVGLAHVALAVDDVSAMVETLKKRGLSFDTAVINGPGLTQAFSSRCPNTGVSIELVHRNGEKGFLDNNIQELFEQLEQSGKYSANLDGRGRPTCRRPWNARLYCGHD